MNGEVIKSFLVGLGFSVDASSLSKFNKALASATVKVTGLYVGIKTLAAATVAGIASISSSFEQMGYEYRLIAPAVNKAMLLRAEMLKAYRLAGVNIQQVIRQSIQLNLSLTKTKMAFTAIYQSVAAKFFPLLTKQSDAFRKQIYANMPKIQAALEKFIRFIFKALEATTALGMRVWSILTRVWDFFKRLHDVTDGWSTVILGVVAAWKLLNLSFLATPLGMILTGLLALIALYDDFMVWKEGGKALIDWGSDAVKMFVGIAAGILAVSTALKTWTLISSLIALLRTFNATLAITSALSAIAAAPLWLIAAAVGAIITALTLADQKWKIFGGHLSGFFTGIGGKVLDFIGGEKGKNLAANIASNPAAPNAGASPAAPGVAPRGPTPILGAQTAASQNLTNQNVQQQTNININGSADANATGKAVAGEQSRVNFDLVRNMRGATR